MQRAGGHCLLPQTDSHDGGSRDAEPTESQPSRTFPGPCDKGDKGDEGDEADHDDGHRGGRQGSPAHAEVDGGSSGEPPAETEDRGPDVVPPAHGTQLRATGRGPGRRALVCRR
ncbi:hypothetical protein GCM10025786_00680 [Nocardioides caeni]